MSIYETPEYSSIIAGLQAYLKTYTGLKEGAPLWVSYLGNSAVQYDILPLPGNKTIETYINDKELKEFPFAFRSMESTADELARLEAIGFYESFSDWLDSQTDAGNLPTLPEGKTAEAIESLGWGYLYQEGVSATGIYQVQCRLVYEE